jgi:hypothetical protein
VLGVRYVFSGVTGLQDDSVLKGRKLPGALSVGSNPTMLLISGFPSSPTGGGVGVQSNRNIPLREVVLYWLVSLRKRGEFR